MKELAYVNGVFLPIQEATVSVEDRGFQFGDSLYEVIHTYGGDFLLLQEHMDRLRRGAGLIGLKYDFERNPLEPILAEGMKRSGLRDAWVYLQITRGVAPRNHDAPTDIEPTVVLTFRPAIPVPEALRRRGASVMTTPDIRWAHCYIKTTTLLPNVLAKSEATRKNYDDALFVTAAGEVRECTSSNVFRVSGGRLEFPPRDKSVLHGITQGFLFECAESIDLRVDERVLHADALLSADEVFMSSTGVEVLGITSIDGRPIGDGAVGPITRRLHEAFKRLLPRKLTHLESP